MSNTIETIIQNNETLYNNMNEIAKTQQRAYNKGMAEGQKAENEQKVYEAGYDAGYLEAVGNIESALDELHDYAQALTGET